MRTIFRTGLLLGVLGLFAIPFITRADTGSVSEDFGNLDRREERTSYANWDTNKRQLTLPQVSGSYAPSASAESRTIANASSQVFKRATLTVESEVPGTTRVDYFLTANGSYWESVQPNQEYIFKNPGNDLRFKIVLFSDNRVLTPVIKKLKIDYVREAVASADTYRNNDNQRMNDMRDTANALTRFKAERRSYPIVDGGTPKDRWVQVMRLLVDGRFLSKTLLDPKQSPDSDFYYDYLSGGNGNSYLIRAKFEDAGNTTLNTDKDGVFGEISGNYTCNDPWYCDGQGLTPSDAVGVPVARPFSPLTDAKPSGTVVTPIGSPSTAGGSTTSKSPLPADRAAISFELVRDSQGKVWYLANTIGEKQVKLLIPSVDMLEDRTNVEVHVRSMAASALNRIPRARLVKSLGRNEIFFLTGNWQRRFLPTWEIFKSYKSNDLKNVAQLDEAILGLYDEAKLGRLDNGDGRIWFIEGKTKRLVPNDRAMRRYNLHWEDVSGMNEKEFDYYEIGEPLE